MRERDKKGSEYNTMWWRGKEMFLDKRNREEEGAQDLENMQGKGGGLSNMGVALSQEVFSAYCKYRNAQCIVDCRFGCSFINTQYTRLLLL